MTRLKRVNPIQPYRFEAAVSYGFLSSCTARFLSPVRKLQERSPTHNRCMSIFKLFALKKHLHLLKGKPLNRRSPNLKNGAGLFCAGGTAETIKVTSFPFFLHFYLFFPRAEGQKEFPQSALIQRQPVLADRRKN